VRPSNLDVTVPLNVAFGDRSRQHVNLIDQEHLIAIGSSTGGIAAIGIYGNQWRTILTKPPFPIRSGVASVATPSKVILLGGVGVTDGIPMATVQVFHRSSQRWETVSSLESPRTHAVAVAVNLREYMYLVGGNLSNTEIVGLSDSFPVRRQGPALHVPRVHHAAVAISNKVILIFGGVPSSSLNNAGGSGGGGGGGSPVTEIEAWHLVSNTIVVVGHWANARSYASAVFMDQHVFLVGQGSNTIEKIWVDMDRLNNIEDHLIDLRSPTLLYAPIPPPPSSPSASAGEELVHHHNDAPVEQGTMNLATREGPFFQPPSRPSVRFCTSLLDRISALSEYAKSLETIQREQGALEECLQRVDAYYDAAVKRLGDERLFRKVETERRITSWNNENQQLMKRAIDQQAKLEEFAQTKQLTGMLQALAGPDNDSRRRSQPTALPHYFEFDDRPRGGGEWEHVRAPSIHGLVTDTGQEDSSHVAVDRGRSSLARCVSNALAQRFVQAIRATFHFRKVEEARPTQGLRRPSYLHRRADTSKTLYSSVARSVGVSNHLILGRLGISWLLAAGGRHSAPTGHGYRQLSSSLDAYQQ
jgi:hypothetical protein